MATKTVGFPLVCWAWVNALKDVFVIMAVDFLYVPLKRTPFVGQWFKAGNFLDTGVKLQAIVIDDGTEVVEFLVSCPHRGFPNLSFFTLAIPKHDVGTGRAVPQTGSEGHTNTE